jgi:hypothetical protein
MWLENTAARAGVRSGPPRRGPGASEARAGAGLIAVALLLGLALGTSRPAAVPATEEALELLRLSAADRRRLEGGATVSYTVPETSERELTSGLAMVVPAPLAQVGDALAAGQLIAQDAAVSSLDIVSGRAGPAAMVGARFTSAERAEAEGLLEAEPGTRFNLSPGEIAELRKLRAPSTPAAGLAQVWDEYGRLLSQRWEAYRQGGISAVAPYARAGGTLTDPAGELRLAAEDAARLPGTEPSLRDTLLRYPFGATALSVDRFYWVRQQLQRRPALSLLHQIVQTRAAAVIHVERYFYVGHSFNSAQTLTGAMAHGPGTLLFSTSRVSTDEVLGPGNAVKRALGRRQLQDSMRRRLDRFRATLLPDGQGLSIQTP